MEGIFLADTRERKGGVLRSDNNFYSWRAVCLKPEPKFPIIGSSYENASTSSIFIVVDLKVHFIEIISRRCANFTKAVLQVIKVQVVCFLTGLKESLAYYNKPEYQL